MSQIYVIRANDGSKSVYVRHKCRPCVRGFVTIHSRSDEFKLWCDKELSTVFSLHGKIPLGLDPAGPTAILKRVTHDND